MRRGDRRHEIPIGAAQMGRMFRMQAAMETKVRSYLW